MSTFTHLANKLGFDVGDYDFYANASLYDILAAADPSFKSDMERAKHVSRLVLLHINHLVININTYS